MVNVNAWMGGCIHYVTSLFVTSLYCLLLLCFTLLYSHLTHLAAAAPRREELHDDDLRAPLGGGERCVELGHARDLPKATCGGHHPACGGLAGC